MSNTTAGNESLVNPYSLYESSDVFTSRKAFVVDLWIHYCGLV